MPSAFVGVVRSVVRELDHSGELIPVDSLRSSSSFQPYCLLSRKPRSSWFWKPRFSCVNLSIRDILAPDAPVPDLDRCGSFHFSDAVDGQLQGSMGLASPGQGKISGGAAVSGSSSASMNVCTLRVDPNIWETLHKERRLRKPEPKILKQLRSCRDNVYVVTEVLQTQEVVKVTRTSKQEGSSQFALPGSMCLQGESQGHLSRRKTVTIPAGSVLAFRVAQLVIDDDWGERGWGLWALKSGRSRATSRACRQRWRRAPRSCSAWRRGCGGSCWGPWRASCGTPQPCTPYRPRWSRACAAARSRSPWMARPAPSSTAWCCPPERWCQNSPALSSTCWGR